MLAVLGLMLATPVTAGAAPIQFGSPLTPGPSGAFGCEAVPVQTNFPSYGDFQLFPNTFTADCTWRQAGVYGSLTDPRTSGVPGDGRIVAAEILSGPNPAPVRITVLRQLNAQGQAGQCCFFVSETAPVALAPNAVTAVPLNIPVERNTLKGVLAADLMALSAVNGQGSLPLREVGPHNTLTMGPGSIVAGFFYPRMGAEPNDNGGGRLEESIAGTEVLVRWTWCANGDAACQPAPPQVALPPQTAPAAQAPGAIAPRLARQLAEVRRNSALIALACGGNLLCQGQLELLNGTGATASAAKAPRVVYGRAAYRIAAGAKQTVAVRLNRRGRALLKARKRATVTLRVLPTGGSVSTAGLTLKRSAARAK